VARVQVCVPKKAYHGERSEKTKIRSNPQANRRGNLKFFKSKITRKMMNLFFTQDLGSKPISKAIHHGGHGGRRRKSRAFHPGTYKQNQEIFYLFGDNLISVKFLQPCRCIIVSPCEI
jgi:hypothetical protein